MYFNERNGRVPTNYSRGRAFEYKVRDFLKKSWPLVVRAAGSKGPVDIVAIRPETSGVLLVSCKKAAYWPKAEIGVLKALEGNNVIVSLAYVNKQGHLEFKGLHG